jgi:hypothetical protein
MKDINCPKCNEIIKIDESSFAEILKKVRDDEFNKQVETTVEALVAKNIADNKKKVTDLQHQLELDKVQNERKLVEQEKELNAEIRRISSERDLYKDMKARNNIKGLGEDLEKWCKNEFDKIRASAFPNAKFGKDNDSSSGTKGDFIFRDYDEDGNEYISIMFEMKNQADDTIEKSKNEKFYSKLDSDRKKKNCEYAVLVSLLELENDLFEGIVDVSHEFEKMYVVRPQDFISIISLLRNPARKLIGLKAELELVKKKEVDVEKFESRLSEFKVKFGKNAKITRDRHESAIVEIEKAIKNLEKTRDVLKDSSGYLDLSESNLNDLTIKSLTWNNPNMAAKFKQLDN